MIVAVAALVAGAVACGPIAGSAPPASSPSGEGAPPSAAVEPSAAIPDDIAHAISQRKVFGLRSDLEWVTQVAA
ncbi:MAG TPA: hypothetical protein VF196_02980, partial [Casimicrobiaceae bacterium]